MIIGGAIGRSSGWMRAGMLAALRFLEVRQSLDEAGRVDQVVLQAGPGDALNLVAVPAQPLRQGAHVGRCGRFVVGHLALSNRVGWSGRSWCRERTAAGRPGSRGRADPTTQS